ncbi:MAG TPA: (2Fe-2S)-binding protein [Planctomycetota bacterium]|jgi:xanthine dehydrogenase YagT iron-sulfur-binding subunit|nr:(2Fe-2S)-binding protein [Planctomycetota bacterium]
MNEDPKSPRAREFSRRAFLQSAGLAGVAAGCASTPSESAGGTPPQGLGPGAVPVTLKVNGREIRLELEPRVTLLDALRDHFEAGGGRPVDLTGSKRVCDRGSCGACTVILDGRTAYACSILAVDAQGREIRTVESFEKAGALHPVQEEFLACDGLMCGFCTPGFVVSSVALLERNPSPTREEIRRALDGNICRCGTQPRSLEAVEKAAARMKGRR